MCVVAGRSEDKNDSLLDAYLQSVLSMGTWLDAYRLSAVIAMTWAEATTRGLHPTFPPLRLDPTNIFPNVRVYGDALPGLSLVNSPHSRSRISAELHHHPTWLAFFEGSRPVYRRTSLRASNQAISAQRNSLAMGLTLRSGMLPLSFSRRSVCCWREN